MTSHMNMTLSENKTKMTKGLSDIIEYKEEFIAAMAEEALTLPDRKPFTDQK